LQLEAIETDVSSSKSFFAMSTTEVNALHFKVLRTKRSAASLNHLLGSIPTTAQHTKNDKRCSIATRCRVPSKPWRSYPRDLPRGRPTLLCLSFAQQWTARQVSWIVCVSRHCPTSHVSIFKTQKTRENVGEKLSEKNVSDRHFLMT